MIFRKFGYANNLALLHASRNWKDLDRQTEIVYFYLSKIIIHYKGNT